MAKKQKKPIEKLSTSPIGDYGNQYFGGIFTDEYLKLLQGQSGIDTFNKMRVSDPQIGAVLSCIKFPILSCSWMFQPASQDSEDVLINEALQAWFFEGNETQFGTLLSQILTMAEFGFSLFERTWTTFEYNGKTYIVPKLDIRVQKSVQEIHIDKKIVKQMKSDNNIIDLAFDRLVFFVMNQEGSNLYGKSMIRNAYKPWYYKTQIENIQAIGIERMAVGLPVGKVPSGTNPDTEEYQAFEEMLKNLVCHENGYAIIPNNYELEVLEGKFNAMAVQNAINNYDTKIAKSVLAQFIELGTGGNGGAYNLGVGQMDMFFSSLQFIINYIEQVFYREIIKPFVDYNFGSNKVYPKITGLGLNENSIRDTITNLKMMLDGKVITPTVEDEVYFREILKLPRLSPDEIEDRKERISEEGMQEDVSAEGTPEETAEQSSGIEKEDDELTQENVTAKLSEKVKTVSDEDIDFIRIRAMRIAEKYVADKKVKDKPVFSYLKSTEEDLDRRFSAVSKLILANIINCIEPAESYLEGKQNIEKFLEVIQYKGIGAKHE